MRKIVKLSAALMFILPLTAFAHTGGESMAGHWQGFVHPFMGIDHLLAMLAVGLWASQMGGLARWAVPGSFVLLMLAGGGMGMLGIQLPYVEAVIVFSVFLLGVLIAGEYSFSTAVSMLIVGGFALFHGHAHGAEMPVASDVVFYVLGFTLSTALLHAAGIFCGLALRQAQEGKITRLTGAAIALAGACLAAV